MILLQTIPNHINIDALQKELLAAFPGIVNVHDFHVWQLAGTKIISTVHIIFLDPTVTRYNDNTFCCCFYLGNVYLMKFSLDLRSTRV